MVKKTEKEGEELRQWHDSRSFNKLPIAVMLKGE